MKKQKYYISLKPNEVSLIIKCLNEQRSIKLKEGKDIEYEQALLLKVMGCQK